MDVLFEVFKLLPEGLRYALLIVVLSLIMGLIGMAINWIKDHAP